MLHTEIHFQIATTFPRGVLDLNSSEYKPFCHPASPLTAPTIHLPK